MSMSERTYETYVNADGVRVGRKTIRKVKIGMDKIDMEDLGYKDYTPEISYIHSFDIYIEAEDEWIDCEGEEHEKDAREWGEWWRVPEPDESYILEQLFHYDIEEGDWVPFKYKLLVNGESSYIKKEGQLCWRGSKKDATVEFRA